MSKEKAIEYLENAYNRLIKGGETKHTKLIALEAIEIASQPEWISVEEKLPEKGLNVLLYRPDPFSKYMIEVGYLIDKNQYELIIWSCRGNPTHWMSLPEPPKL